MAPSPLVVFDTNILMDVWLKRDQDQAVLLVRLAEKHRIELVVPGYVLHEFRGTALRWLREQRVRLDALRVPAKDWARSGKLDQAAMEISTASQQIDTKLKELMPEVDETINKIHSVARVPPHTPDIHFRGDIRYLSGQPPDRPVDGLKDCRIYEALLEIAHADRSNDRKKYFVSKDSDFSMDELLAELRGLGFDIRNDLGRLYGELK